MRVRAGDRLVHALADAVFGRIAADEAVLVSQGLVVLGEVVPDVVDGDALDERRIRVGAGALVEQAGSKRL
ncbi:hypothetical protein [Streptomyces mirabilis]|uniref:hypothetical protein n=1 Tax=Streptomyces mirabilis TaxID=68239 RepID=UPI003812BD8F